MKIIKRIIVILVVLIVLCISIIIYLNYTKNKIQIAEQENNVIVEYDDTEKLEIEEKARRYHEENPGMVIDGVVPKQEVYQDIINQVESCIRVFIINTTKGNSNAVYSMLDNEWKEQNNLTVENVLNTLNYEHNPKSKIDEIYSVAGEKYATYYIKYILANNIIFFTVNIDISSNSFSIIPITGEVYNQKITEPAVGSKYEKTIEANEYNNIDNIEINKEDFIEPDNLERT